MKLMHTFIRLLFLATLVVSFVSCTSGKVVKRNEVSGYFPSTEKATVLKSESVELDSKKSLLLVPNDEFTMGMAKEIGYFEKVINFDDLERIIVKKGITDSVTSVDSIIGINKAAKALQNFLWLTWRYETQDNKYSVQLALVDANNMHDIFVCETESIKYWGAENDQSNFYPMMNALVDYINTNSNTFKKTSSSD